MRVRRVGPKEQRKRVSDPVASQARNGQTLKRLVAGDKATGPTVRILCDFFARGLSVVGCARKYKLTTGGRAAAKGGRG